MKCYIIKLLYLIFLVLFHIVIVSVLFSKYAIKNIPMKIGKNNFHSLRNQRVAALLT